MTNAESPQQTAALTIDRTFKQAIDHHQAGQLQDAERLYRAILQAQPNHPDANHNLGVLAVQVKQSAVGLRYFKAALEANPNRSQYWLSYIDALIQTGQTDAARQVLAQGRKLGLNGESVEAIAARLVDGALAAESSSAGYQHAFEGAPHNEKDPGPQEIHTMVAMFTEGRYTEAATLAQTMTAHFPLHWAGWKMLGVVFKQMGRSADALAPMQKAAALLPGDAEAHSNLGGTLYDLGRLDEAEAICRRALEINPDYAAAHCILGNIFQRLGRLDAAEMSLRRALKIKPDFAVAHSDMGITLQAMGRLGEAEMSYRLALEIEPDFADALFNLGRTLCDLDDLNQAAVIFQKTLGIDPANRGLDAAVYLAILHYLDGNLERCRNMLLASQPIMLKTDSNYTNSRNYWLYLDKLLSWHRRTNQNDNQMQCVGRLHVIGDSHSLSAHGMAVRYNGQEMRCAAEWIEGCKQWHLGNGMANKYKHKFGAVMARLPRNSTILLLIGEIDCRHDEGIIKASRKYPDKPLAGIMQSTVEAYLNYVAAIGSRYGHRIIIGGVPATNIQLDALTATVTEQFVHLIRIFNNALKWSALDAGMDFLDVYALTDRGDGIASGERHLDYNHLLPSAVAEAFDKHCVQRLRDEAR